MADITAYSVKELRERTGAGMMDAKNALVECNGDVESAVDYLRKKGLAKAAKKAGRTAAEGLIGISVNDNGRHAAILEVNSETDFVARNDKFQNFVTAVTSKSLQASNDDIQTVASLAYDGSKTVQETLTDLIATIGENMSLRRCKRLQVSNGLIASYVHNALAPNLGKIGVLVALESDASADALQALGKHIAMHVAAAGPQFLSVSEVDPQTLEREKQILREQSAASGKPADIIEKMIQGRINKFYEEVVLLEQVSVIDGENKISKLVENTAKETGKPVKLAGFVRFNLGEGIEKEETDFAAEVAKTAKGG